MKTNTPWFREVTSSWLLLPSLHLDDFHVVDRHGNKIELSHSYLTYKHPTENKLTLRIKKNHWAVGRKMTIESQNESVLSGEYVIVEKAVSNSYDVEDLLMIEYVNPVLDTSRKAMNWIERKIAELEAKDGKTTEDLVREMNVRGD